MEAAGSIDDFLRRPVGRYVAGPSYVIWVHSPSLLGNIYFGRPDQQALADHRRMFRLPLHADLTPPFDVILDAGSLEHADLACYELLVWYVAHEMPRFIPLVRRLALIPPESLMGATLVGIFHQFVAPSFKARLCRDRDEAFAWLRRGDGAQAKGALDGLFDDVVRIPPVVQNVRARLAAQPGLRIDQVARSLGMSERSLQRELAEADTSFRAEARRARLHQAETLLRDTTLKIEAVARKVGYSSLANFSAHFRRVRGLSPSAFRRGGA